LLTHDTTLMASRTSSIVSQVEISAICPLGISMRRIGQIVYWVGCSTAALILALGVYLYLVEFKTRDDNLIMALGFLVAALLVWTAGRLMRAVISDE
jgi:uncharacterized membrane protein